MEDPALATVSTLMSEDDFVRAQTLTRRGRIWWMVALIIGFLIATPTTLFIAGALFLGRPPPSAVVEVALVGWVAIVSVVYELSGWRARREWRKRPVKGEPIVSTWTADGLEMRVDTAVVRYRWSDFRAWREDDHALVAWTHDAHHLQFPKRQLPPEALEELRSYLAAGLSPSPPANPPTSPAPRTDPDVRVSVSEDDFVEAYVALNRRMGWIGVAAMVALLVAGLASMPSILDSGGTSPLGIYLSLAAVTAATVWIIMVGPRGSVRNGRRAYRLLLQQGKPMELGWSAEGVDTISPTRWERLGWETFVSWRETPGTIIALTRHKSWMAFPKRGLTEAIIADLKMRLGGERTRKGRAP